jgi:hypothetical protein
VDSFERIGILSLAALSKARELRKIPLDAALRSKVAEIMKTVRDTGKKVKALTDAASSNGVLDRAKTERALDRILKSLQDANRELDELLDQARK